MKKLMLILFLCLIPSICNAATSDDVYVRKDIFEVYMKRIDDKFEQIHADIMTIKNDIKEIDNKVQNLTSRVGALTSRVDVLTSRVDGFDARLSDFRNNMYLWFVIAGLIVVFPYIQKFLEWHDKKKLSFIIEDVKRLIEESKHS